MAVNDWPSLMSLITRPEYVRAHFRVEFRVIIRNYVDTSWRTTNNQSINY